jgi:hypothetical protein
VCKNKHKQTHTSIQVQRRHPAFPAQWFDGLCRDLPGDEFVLSPSLTNIDLSKARLGFANLRQLDASFGRQDHTTVFWHSVKHAETKKTL